ncbi:Hsp70 family protein [Actinoplanes aureus]|uniref:Hsp70 family protein n=1 Tax=Actinoplanes aureus TaxID=2792083 RepID=UPI001E534884|nr:Hsp70 family protein [Actinoplanes aureus]
MSIDQGGPKRYALGIDFGTSNTVAVARWPDGRARPILVDGSPLLPSAVYADAAGNLLVGRDAVHSARLDPARFEPNPKRRVDDGLVLLGEREFEAVELITAVLARVTEEWHRAVGPYRPQTTLTCPASWGAARRTLLAEAAARAGLEGARLVAEPVAAATYFAEILGRDVPIGSVVMVHDFGAGTFDASVVARTSSGFEVLAVDGRDDLGGLDVDAAIVEYLRTDEWGRLMEPATVEERRARRQLWDDVRIAKERLSRAQSADFVVPLLDSEAHLTRDELETVARPVLEQTVRVTKNLLRWADLPEGRLAGVFLVGGASRIPLVATLLHRELGDPPVVIEQPELVVAEGSILAGAALLSTEPAAPGPTEELRLPSKYLPSGTGLIVLNGKPAAESQAPTVVAAGLVAEQPAAAETELIGRSDMPNGADFAETELIGRSGMPSGPDAADHDPAATADPEPEAGQATVVTGTPPGSESAPHVAEQPGTGTPVSERSGEPGSGRREIDQARLSQPDTPSTLGTERLGAAHAPAEPAEPAPEDVPLPKRTKRPVAAETPDEPDMPPHLRPPVDPWPNADPSTWRPDPDATAAAAHPSADDGWKPEENWGRGDRWKPDGSWKPVPPPRGNRPTTPVVAHARPISPVAAQPHPVSPVVGSARPVPSARAVAAAPRPPRQQGPEPARQKRPKRRGGRFLRAMQILISLITMVLVPIVALVLAYGYANGAPLQEDAVNVFEDLAELLGFQ